MLRGGFTSSLGQFQASWRILEAGNAYTLEWNAPSGTVGEVVLPALPAAGVGTVIYNGARRARVGSHGSITMTVEGGGTHLVEVIRA